MSKFYSSIINELSPYVPGEQPKDKSYIKLNTNENPYPPSPKAIEAMSNSINDDLRLYPEPNSSGIKIALAEHYGLNKDQIFVGNGSDEVLAFAFKAFFEPESTILFPSITYSFYPVYAQLFGIKVKTTSLDDDMKIKADELYGAEGGVIIANPNAPTGVALSLEEVAMILDANPNKVVIIDEAYVDFGAQSAIPLLSEYPNLLIVQTLSKSRALAGIRIGYALGSTTLIQALEMVKNSFNSYTIDRISMVGAIASIKDNVYNINIQEKIVATREKTDIRLRELGFKVTESLANFLFVSPPDKKAEALYLRLREQGFLVRFFRDINQWLRITVGTDEEMDALLTVLEREYSNVQNK